VSAMSADTAGTRSRATSLDKHRFGPAWRELLDQHSIAELGHGAMEHPDMDDSVCIDSAQSSGVQIYYIKEAFPCASNERSVHDSTRGFEVV
jgi:hypothetical protein